MAHFWASACGKVSLADEDVGCDQNQASKGLLCVCELLTGEFSARRLECFKGRRKTSETQTQVSGCALPPELQGLSGIYDEETWPVGIWGKVWVLTG